MAMRVSTVALPDLDTGGNSIPRDQLEGILAGIERQYKPQSSRRFQDADWTKVFAADGGKDIAMVIRLPLKHS